MCPNLCLDRLKIFIECEKLPPDFREYSLNFNKTFLLNLQRFSTGKIFIEQTIENLELKLHLQDST